MSEARADREAGGVEDLTPAELLATIKASRETENAEAARQLVLAAAWADLHPPESIHDAAAFTVPGCEHEEPIAGDGAPLVAEFCVAELGTTLGISSTAAKKLMGHALELRHRPRQPARSRRGRRDRVEQAVRAHRLHGRQRDRRVEHQRSPPAAVLTATQPTSSSTSSRARPPPSTAPAAGSSTRT